MIGKMLIAWLISALLFVGLHCFKWSQIFGKPMEPPQTYIAGVLGLGVVYSGLLLYWAFYRGIEFLILALIAFWGVVAFGGGTVWGLYILDDWLEKRAKAKDKQAREELEAKRRGHAQQ